MLSRIALVLVLACSLVLAGLPTVAGLSSSAGSGTQPDILMATLEKELSRAQTALAKSDPAPYFLSYTATDTEGTTIAGTLGSLITSLSGHARYADVIMHVGGAALDNTHGASRESGIVSGALPLNDDPDAIARILWQLTNREYEQAAGALLKVKTNTAVRSEEEDKSPDFSSEAPQVRLKVASPTVAFDRSAWEQKVRRLSAKFADSPGVYDSAVVLQVSQSRSYLATSEGTRVETASAFSRLIIEASTRADDGMDLVRVETFQAAAPGELPAESEMAAKIEKMAADLKALRAAPAADPYAGPALLSGRAAAVFFHEVLGHRLEGHRQRDEREGQTFTKKVNQLVLPSFLSVVDDPTRSELGGVKLSGSYDFDDEGTPAGRVVAVENGILREFLMSRIPIKNFTHSNGHGRRQPGRMATGRQGNLIVTSTRTVKDSELRQKFIDEIKKQGKAYGLYFEDIEGGFTLTSRSLPQAFQILPVMVWRVYADGRPDELVRGVDIVGTPLASLNEIIFTGDTLQVFNGVCGAESGQIPVSAAAPAMLFSEMEVQKRANSRERPPILPPPTKTASATASGAHP